MVLNSDFYMKNQYLMLNITKFFRTIKYFINLFGQEDGKIARMKQPGRVGNYKWNKLIYL